MVFHVQKFSSVSDNILRTDTCSLSVHSFAFIIVGIFRHKITSDDRVSSDNIAEPVRSGTGRGGNIFRPNGDQSPIPGYREHKFS